MKLINILKEVIKASEAYNVVDSVQTVVNGKRTVAFITKGEASSRDWALIQEMIEDNNLKVLHVDGNPNDAFVVYSQGHASDAMELKTIAEKYGGYLAYNASKEDARRIGQLLGYIDSDIENFINKPK